jgi:hypothetical protein
MVDRPFPPFGAAAYDPRRSGAADPASDRHRPAAAAPPPMEQDDPLAAQPRRRRRCWTPQRRQRFLEALAETGSVSAACEEVGLSRESAYRLRRRPDERAFKTAWESARAAGLRMPARIGFDASGHWRRPSDARAMAMLRRLDPLTYGGRAAAPDEAPRKPARVAPPRRLPSLLVRLLRRGRADPGARSAPRG